MKSFKLSFVALFLFVALAGNSFAVDSVMTSWNRKKYTVTTADLTALGAVLNGDITLDTVPPGTVVRMTLVKPLVAVTGVTTCVGYVRTTTPAVDFGVTTFNLKAAVSATNFDFYATPKAMQFASSTPLVFHVITTVDNLSAVTAGTIEIWIDFTPFFGE